MRDLFGVLFMVLCVSCLGGPQMKPWVSDVDLPDMAQQQQEDKAFSDEPEEGEEPDANEDKSDVAVGDVQGKPDEAGTDEQAADAAGDSGLPDVEPESEEKDQTDEESGTDEGQNVDTSAEGFGEDEVDTGQPAEDDGSELGEEEFDTVAEAVDLGAEVETEAVNPCEGVDCYDGNKCTLDDCDPTSGKCLHVGLICDDGNSCTEDSCDPAIGCVHVKDVVNDKDFDCIKDVVDNCPDDYNPDQADVDLDGLGDECDPSKDCVYSQQNLGLPTDFYNWPGGGGCVAICKKADGSTACLAQFNWDGNCHIDLDGDGVSIAQGDCHEWQSNPDPFWCWKPNSAPPNCQAAGWSPLLVP